MKGYVALVILASLGWAGVPAVAGQVVATEGITLTEAAQEKFNRDTGDSGDRYVKPIPGSSERSRQLYASAGLTPEEGRALSLNDVFVAKINRESAADDRQRVIAGGAVSVSRGYGSAGDHGRLAAAARLSPDEAANLSLTEIAAAKFAAEGNSGH